MRKTTPQIRMANTPIRAPRLPMFSCKGVLFSALEGRQAQPPLSLSSEAIISAISPMRVSIPVATTTPLHLPLATGHPEKTMFSGVSLVCSLILVFLDTSSGSPVKAFSSTFKSAAVISRRSAGTTSPVSSRMMSPRTTSTVGMLTTSPPRITETSGCDNFARASKALPAAFSVYAAIPAFKMTKTKIAIPVVYERTSSRLPSLVAFTTMEAIAAMISRMMMKLVSCKRNNMKRPNLGSCVS
mmetsp:Transcript_47545/g.103634  ORF Transcript_47545/g.103634 Transcript_47545/m.103634 type:complete len:242 (+) Transcript_47545:103-828(+)